MQQYIAKHPLGSCSVRIIPLYPIQLDNSAALDAYEAECLQQAYEGVMVRTPGGRYKAGRSTVKEALLLKVKRFVDAEAVVVGVEELQHNDNEAVRDALGHSKRSSHQAGKTGAGVLGAMVVRDRHGIVFKIGTGFTAAMRAELWRQDLTGRLAKYKYQSVGTKVAPRHPVFIGFRDPADT
jgi:DNA ligase-1